MRYLKLNGKRVTKFDLGHIIDALYPAWHSNAWLMTDVWSYSIYIDEFVEALKKATDNRLNCALSFYYDNDYLNNALKDVLQYKSY